MGLGAVVVRETLRRGKIDPETEIRHDGQYETLHDVSAFRWDVYSLIAGDVRPHLPF
jgi:hypothetical protein